jgi:hypothetical protein
VTSRPIKTLPDGTRWYKCGHGYLPLSADERTNGVRKPGDPRAVRFHGQWFLPLELVEEQAREMPETIPDAETLLHWAGCMCRVCRRPQATVLWRRRARTGRAPTP